MAPRIAVELACIFSWFVYQCICDEPYEDCFAWEDFSARAILSTVFGESADSLIFFPLAFGGLMPISELGKMMLVQVVLKTMYEIIILPITIRVVKYIKHVDDCDVYDEHISYNVLKIKEI